jgi:hypothetical protein
MSMENLPHVERPTNAWVTFSYVSLAGSLLMVGGGIAYLPLDWWVRGYFAMGLVMVIQSCFTVSKNVRDLHEAGRMFNRIQEARTEKLLRSDAQV